MLSSVLLTRGHRIGVTPETSAFIDSCAACAVKGGVFQWVKIPPGDGSLQPEAVEAIVEGTNRNKTPTLLPPVRMRFTTSASYSFARGPVFHLEELL